MIFNELCQKLKIILSVFTNREPLLNNGFQFIENYDVEDVLHYENEYKGNIYTYFSDPDSVICRYYYNNTNDTLDEILFLTQNIEGFKKLKNSILADSSYIHDHSTATMDDYHYRKFITNNPFSDEDERWIFEVEISFVETHPSNIRDIISGKRNYLIQIRHYDVYNIYGNEEFDYFKKEGRKRYLEMVK